MDPQTAVKRTVDEVESLTGCPVQVVQDSSVKNMAVLDIQKTFRSKTPCAERMDAVMYLVGAIDNFAGMSKQDVKKIGFEVATRGMKGFDVNDSTQKYELRSVPGRFSGLHMVCLMHAAFKITDPTADIGFDLAEEYATANQMRGDRRNS